MPPVSTSLENAISVLRTLRVHDVSPTLEQGMPIWSMFDGIVIDPLFEHAEHGAAVNRLVLCEHTGLHVDAPFHFDAGGRTMEEVPVDALLLRPYKKYDLSGESLDPGDLVGVDQLTTAETAGGFSLEQGDVAIVDFGWDRHYSAPDNWWGRNEPGLSEEACRYLAEAGIAAVASDTAGCDVAARDGEVLAGHGHTTHFLPRGILIVEGLQRLATAPPTGLFLALPLKIKGGTGSPIRVVLLTE
jgi:kynurenine formamidase